MDPQGHFNLGENTPPFNLAEIWPFSGGAVGCAAASSFHDGSNAAAQRVADNISRSMNVGLNVNLVRDPMVVMEQQAPNSITNRVKRRLEEDGHSAGGGVSTSCDANMMNECNNKRIKTAGGSNENRELKAEGEANKSKSADQKAKTADLSKQDYIHVRARRGQATDSHSLAERARREKISERMKTLQDLVPGCNKVIGKALVLDEIINYVQSLQRQVEFLSMKLEAVTSRLGPGIEGFPLKDFGQPPFEASGMPFGPQSSGNYDRSTSPEWLHMQIGGGFDRTT